MDPRIQKETIDVMVKGTPCPAPFSITLDANIPFVENSDFNAVHLANYQTALGFTGKDKGYLHTFIWKPQAKCCQVTKAVLTVKLKANQSGTANGANAGNDTISIIHAGASVAPYSEKVYSSWPFPAGQTAVKTWNLTGAALTIINTSKRLSFGVQDDTMVESATLQLSGCCLKLG
jgi:hypothetical protein